MATTEIVLRAVPLWLLRHYITEIGAQEHPDGWLHGKDWQARLTQVEDFQIGSLRVGQVRFDLQGDDAVIADIWRQLEPKLIRAGG